jgi:tripartite-type tricarboxylate transporter receptor subunit TctC
MFSNVINSGPHVRAGRLRSLAITSAKRSKTNPQLPTVSEAGLPGYQADVWYGVLVPARTPSEIVQRLNREINAILRTPDFLQKAATQGADVIGGTPAELGALMRTDLAKWAKLTAKLQLQME